MSNTFLFWAALAGALLSLLGLAAAVRLKDRWLGVVAIVAAVAFAGSAVFFGWASWR